MIRRLIGWLVGLAIALLGLLGLRRLLRGPRRADLPPIRLPPAVGRARAEGERAGAEARDELRRRLDDPAPSDEAVRDLIRDIEEL